MTLQTLAGLLDLTFYCGDSQAESIMSGAYVTDLLSDALAFAREGQVWFTVRTHLNVLAIAQQKKLAAVVLTCGETPDADLLAEARMRNFPLLGTPLSTFEAAGRTYGLLAQKTGN